MQIILCGLLSYESPKYWRLSNKSVQFTKDVNTDVEYIIDTDRVPHKNIQELKKYLPNVKIVDVTIDIPNKKENNHEKRLRIGQLYNNLFSSIDSCEYLCIMDGDIVFIKKYWDILLTRELINNCVIIGAEYGNRWPKKFQNFPNLSFSIIKWDIVKPLNIDFRGHGKSMLLDSKNCTFFGLKQNIKLNREIGWRMPMEIKKMDILESVYK